MPKRRDGFWLGQVHGSQCWYVCWYDAAARRTRRKSTDETDKAKASLALARHVIEHASPVKRPKAEVQIAAVLHQWNIERGSLIPSSEANAYAVEALGDFFGAATVSDLTHTKVDAFIAWGRKRKWSDSYTNRHLTVLRAAVRHAWKRERLESVPFIQALKENDPPPRHIFTKDELAEFLDRAYVTEHLFRFTMIAANTLARPDAVLDLTPFQVKAEHGFIELNPAGRAQTKKYRATVPITQTLGPWLKSWTGSPYVNWRGKAVAWIGDSFSQVGRDMGLSVSPYCIRHTMATELAKAGVPKEQRDRFMGHKSVDGSRVGERYVHFEPGWLKDARDAIDAYFDSLPVRFNLTPPRLKVVGGTGIEPVTSSMSRKHSTAELTARNAQVARKPRT